MQTVSHPLQSVKVDIENYILAHQCASHPLFACLGERQINTDQFCRFLKNYDAHASLLRRLLLKAATLMPEDAVGFILENVRNEYGNGDFAKCHQGQLRDLVRAAGVHDQEFDAAPISVGVRSFMKKASGCYFPANSLSGRRAAIAAGAITTTEVLALQEFRSMQSAFVSRDLQDHVWFDHVSVEAEHTRESIQLAQHFVDKYHAWKDVRFGIDSMLDATSDLYDGLLECL
jgi:hypothetical protein